MSTEVSTENQKPVKALKPKGIPVGRLASQQVDAALGECDKTIKTHSETVKSALALNVAIPSVALRELSRANSQRSRLVLRRITLAVESGDSSALELVEKLLKVKLPKAG